MRVLSLNGGQNFKFLHFPRYKLEIKLVLKLIKRGDHAVILISTILKFSVQVAKINELDYIELV